MRSLIRPCRSGSRFERPGALSSFAQSRLDRVPVHAPVLHLELVRELLDLPHRLARHEPESDRLLPPPVLLACVDLGEALVRRVHRSRVLERLSFSFLPKDLVDHAASASTTRSTQATSSRESRRNDKRSSDAGPCPVTTARSVSQSGSV